MTERRRRGSTVAERLGRMLVITPYLVNHPGVTVAEVGALFDVQESQLRRDLELLFMSGRPPYGPGDLIDVEVDEDGRITVWMADHFSRPVRLTRQEALAIHLSATELLATPGVPHAPALETALSKLRGSLGDTPGIEAVDRGAAPAFLEEIRAAADAHERLRLDYVAASTGERSWRTVEPEAVFASIGNWYVAAWDVDAEGERLFRVDRVTGVETTGEPFTPRGLEGAGRSLYTPSRDDLPVRVLLHPAARWVAEYYATTEEHERDDGDLEATLPAAQLGWVARLLLRLGGDAEVLEPASLADDVRALARETLTVYGR